MENDYPDCQDSNDNLEKVGVWVIRVLHEVFGVLSIFFFFFYFFGDTLIYWFSLCDKIIEQKKKIECIPQVSYTTENIEHNFSCYWMKKSV